MLKEKIAIKLFKGYPKLKQKPYWGVIKNKSREKMDFSRLSARVAPIEHLSNFFIADLLKLAGLVTFAK